MVRDAFRRPAFIVAVVLLAISAVGLNSAVGFLQLHFKKLPVPLRKPLATVPGDLGPWKQVSQDKPLDAEIQDVLGTDQYIFREYADERIVGAKAIQQLRDLQSAMLREGDPAKLKTTESEYQRVYAEMRMSHPDGVVNLALTYYTGMVDTVAHVPDRCVVADGYEPKPSDSDYTDFKISPEGRTMQVRFVNYEDQTGARRLPRSIAYFFQVNGDYEASHVLVRTKLQDLRKRYGYYAKVEVMTLLDNRTRSAEVLADFLSHAVPPIESVLPDWDAFNRAAEQNPTTQPAPVAAAIAAH